LNPPAVCPPAVDASACQFDATYACDGAHATLHAHHSHASRGIARAVRANPPSRRGRARTTTTTRRPSGDDDERVASSSSARKPRRDGDGDDRDARGRREQRFQRRPGRAHRLSEQRGRAGREERGRLDAVRRRGERAAAARD
jgi:hypothetical protein